jgi:hypothetical protein
MSQKGNGFSWALGCSDFYCEHDPLAAIPRICRITGEVNVRTSPDSMAEEGQALLTPACHGIGWLSVVPPLDPRPAHKNQPMHP